MLDFRLLASRVDQTNFDNLLSGWHTLHKELSKSNSIAWCIALLNYEKANANRLFIRKRIFSHMVRLVGLQFREKFKHLV